MGKSSVLPMMGKELRDPELADKITGTRVKFLSKNPFFANLVMSFPIYEVPQLATVEINGVTINVDAIPTAATDGRAIYYSPEFMKRWNSDKLMFIFAHEVLHGVYNHFTRINGRNREIWNHATDYAINLDLVAAGFIPPTREEFPLCLDDRFEGMSAEQIYDIIKDEMGNEASEGGGASEGGEGGEGGESGHNGNKPLDEHVYGEMDEEGKRNLENEIRRRVMQAAQAAKMRGAGDSIPQTIKDMIKDWTEPKIDWRELLNFTIQSVFKDDFTFARPSRKSHGGIILPGLKPAEEVTLAIAIDTSGSINDEMLRDFLGEVNGIMQQYQAFDLYLWCFDTSVHNPKKFTPDNIHELEEYEIEGRGGTDFECNWQYMKDNDILPKQFVMFTDGYPFDGWGDPSYTDTLFIIHGGDNITPPFGSFAHYESGVGLK